MAEPANDLTAMYQLLTRYFNLEELKNLCFQLGVDFENLGGAGKSAKARELVQYLDRRNRLPELEPLVRQLRPGIAWPQEAAGEPAPRPEPAPANEPAPRPEPTPAGGIQLQEDDFNQLVGILQRLPQFALPDRRLAFLEEVFQGSPRKDDIVYNYDASGMPRTAATRLVNWLIQFGQDKPGRETLGMLVEGILGVIGEGENANSLRSLLTRYGMANGNANEATRQPSPAAVNESVANAPVGGGAAAGPLASRAITLPQRGKDFLQPDDRRWLARTMGELGTFQYFEGRRNLLIDSGIPRPWINQINLDRGGPEGIAKTVINDLEVRGRLPERPQTHALGSLLETLVIDSFGYDDAVTAVALIVGYQLDEDRETLDRLSAQCGVPRPVSVDNVYDGPWQLPQGTLPAGLRAAELENRLEALQHKGRANSLDVAFLIDGAHAARAVCRLEWGKKGEGSGFLIAPDLVLTNYHVINPPQGHLSAEQVQQRLAGCEVRFGVTGRERAGNKLVRLHEEALAMHSEPLDYALLRLGEAVEDGERIVRASVSREAIALDQSANIIQHPLGKAMAVALRNNQVVAVYPQRVYYLSDTRRGSSGSPVFDDRWQVIALHRAGGLKDETGQVMSAANEGVPILDIWPEIEAHIS